MSELPTSVRLSAELRLYLVQAARQQGCSLTWLIRDVLRRWAAEGGRKETDKQGESDAA